jgi:uncharacterized paraquat-inducible protein A
MPKKILCCDECGAEFTVNYKQNSGEPSHCAFCGAELDLDWNVTESDDE